MGTDLAFLERTCHHNSDWKGTHVWGTLRNSGNNWDPRKQPEHNLSLQHLHTNYYQVPACLASAMNGQSLTCKKWPSRGSPRGFPASPRSNGGDIIAMGCSAHLALCSDTGELCHQHRSLFTKQHCTNPQYNTGLLFSFLFFFFASAAF